MPNEEAILSFRSPPGSPDDPTGLRGATEDSGQYAVNNTAPLNIKINNFKRADAPLSED